MAGDSVCFSCGKYKLCTLRLSLPKPILRCDQMGSGGEKKKGKKGRKSAEESD